MGKQWQKDEMKVFWPDGHELHPVIKKVLGAPDGFGGVRHKGTVDYIVPPWAIIYWKNRK
jgi:hypothetical protein